MKQILITGASGFLGRRAAAFFAPRYRVLAPGRGELDVTDRQAVEACMDRYRPDYVLHCAAISDTGRCRREPELAQAVNVDSCVHLARAARSTGSKCLFCSSDQVYSGSRELWPHREDESLSPSNVYGAGKLEAERLCLAENPDCVFLRLSWMYDRESLSPHEHGDFLRTLLPKLVSGEPLPFPIYDRRGITDVREVVENLERALGLPGGIYNFGSANDCSTYVLMQRVFQRLGLEEDRLIPDDRPFADCPRNLCMDPWKSEHLGIFFSSPVEALARSIYPYHHR